MGWLANQTEKTDLKAGKVYIGYFLTNFPEMNPRLEQVLCLQGDKNGRFKHWAITLDDRAGVTYYFSRCLGTWHLQMEPSGFPLPIEKINRLDMYGDCQVLASRVLKL